MKCPVCGHKVRPSKKVPGKYLCDTCRKRFPASAVLPDEIDPNTTSSSGSRKSGSKRHRPVTDPSARPDFVYDPLNEPKIYHSTAEALRSVPKKQTDTTVDEPIESSKPEDVIPETSSDTESSEDLSVDLTDTDSDSDEAIEASDLQKPSDTPEETPVPQDDATASSETPDFSDEQPDSESSDHTKSPARKKKVVPFILAAIVIIAAVAAIAFFLLHSSDKNAAATPSTTQKNADSTKAIYQQGETASYNGIDITLDSYVESEGDDWSVPAEGNEFMFVHMTITNNSTDKSDLVISSMASFENYCDDAKLDYSAAAFTALATTSDQPKLDGTIAPGETLEGYLSLEVPLNWSTVEIRYTDKIWSDEAIHFQIKRQQ